MKQVTISSVIDCLVNAMMPKEDGSHTKALLLRFRFKNFLSSYYRYLLLFRTDTELCILETLDEITRIMHQDSDRRFYLAIHMPVENNLVQVIEKSDKKFFCITTETDIVLEDIRPLFINMERFNVAKTTLILADFKNETAHLSILAE